MNTSKCESINFDAGKTKDIRTFNSKLSNRNNEDFRQKAKHFDLKFVAIAAVEDRQRLLSEFYHKI